MRHGLNRDLGFSAADRIENIRRVAEVTRLMVDAGLIVITSFISPFRAERDFARSLLSPGEFYEVFVDTPIEECERRDPKGPYEAPPSPEIHLHTLTMSPETCVAQLLATIRLRD